MTNLTRSKNQVIHFLHAQGHCYNSGRYWTKRFKAWINQVNLDQPYDEVTLRGYLVSVRKIPFRNFLNSAEGAYVGQSVALLCVDCYVMIVFKGVNSNNGNYRSPISRPETYLSQLALDDHFLPFPNFVIDLRRAPVLLSLLPRLFNNNGS